MRSAPKFAVQLMRSERIALLARVLITSAYWTSGIAKFANFPDAAREVADLGLPLPSLIAFLVIVVQLAGSLLIIFNRYVLAASFVVAAFTLLATLLAHAFWAAPEGELLRQLAIFMEHMGLIGGFIVLGILAAERSRE